MDRFSDLLFQGASLAVYQGAFLVIDNRVLNLPLGRSLRSFARTALSAHSLWKALLPFPSFAHSLISAFTSLHTIFAHSFMGLLKLMNM